ncbi:MAG: DNA internalization-related competence protein ComEC/Rec2 [Desulfatiglans sp.]|nr:DNA internalization-related competence protein ComEC/Rec2 [Desulfatiglans sp.]
MPTSGGKASRIFHRPLTLILFFFAGGILIGKVVSPLYETILLALYLSLILCLLSMLFLSRRLKIYVMLFAFFLTGILLSSNIGSSSQLLPHAHKSKRAVIEGTVLETVKREPGMCRLRVRVLTCRFEEETNLVNEDLLVTIYDPVTPIRPGEKIRFPARLRPFKDFNNPGHYEYEAAMVLKGFSCAATVSDGRYVVPMGPGRMPFPHNLLERIRAPVRDFLRDNLNTRDAALFYALILGERHSIDQDLRESFNKTGLGHILAVSGLHIGLVAWFSFFVLKSILSRSYRVILATDIRRLSALLTSFPVFLYTCLAGFQVSSQRAMIMVMVFLFSLIAGRQREVWSSLALAALVILALDPQAIFSMSFQLSFGAVIGILWITPVFLKALPSPHGPREKRPLFYRLYLYFGGLIAATSAATIFLLPLISFYFHRVSLAGILANITAVPILGMWVLPSGLLSLGILPFSTKMAGFLLGLSAWGLNIMMEVIDLWAGLSWSSVWTITPNLFEMSLFYLLLIAIFFVGYRLWARRLLLVLTIIMIADIGYWIHRVHFNKDLRVTFLDVGQASSAFIEFPGGKKMLIDGGGFPRDYFDVGKMVVAPFLWRSKISHIDYLVLSHPQADHMNGLRFIARHFHPTEFWYNGDEVDTPSYRELMAIVESQDVKKHLPRSLFGRRHINGVTVDVLHPPPGDKALGLSSPSRRLNNRSLVLKISYGGKAFLFPGDIERTGEIALMAHAGKSLKSNILLSPHHGSSRSNMEGFLRMVKPEVCVISSGHGNAFGFPHSETIRRLKKVGCRVIRIDQTGAVGFRVNKRLVQMRTFVGGETPL